MLAPVVRIVGLMGGRIGEDERALYPTGIDILLEIAVTSDCDRICVWSMSSREGLLLPLGCCDVRRKIYIPTRMAAISTITPPTTPPTIAPMGVDLDELELGVGLGDAEGVPTSGFPRTIKLVVSELINDEKGGLITLTTDNLRCRDIKYFVRPICR